MNKPQTTVTAIREVLFRNADTVNHQLLRRFGEVADHLSRQEDRAVIGALEGAEADIAKMRSLMLLLRDCFVVPREEGGLH
jgi:hypothetical protein